MICILEFIKLYWRSLFVLIFPILALPVFMLNDTKAFRCMYGFVIMCGFWITEAIPPALTSLLPMFMFPLMGVLNSDSVARNYMNDTNMMLIGSVAIAIAMENTGLHIRIALTVIKCIGCSIKKLHIGVGMVTMFVSMWIANTAATALMIPIVEGTLVSLQGEGLIKMWREDPGKAPEDQKPTNITMCYYISTAYCSLIGGTGCILGSGSHLAFKGLYETRFPKSPGVEFAKWMLFNVPVMFISNCLIILWLQILYLGLLRPFSQAAKESHVGQEAVATTTAVINRKLEEIGPATFKEYCVGVLFVVSILFWFFRRPGFMPGWPTYITDVKCGDAVVAMVVFTLFFLIPLEPSCIYIRSRDESKRPTQSSPGILGWKVFSQKMHWGMLFVLGGGFAMADAAKASGMTKLVAEYLQGYLSKDILVNLFLICGTGAVMTQFLSSNVACVTILTPIILDMCAVSGFHPMYLGLANALACCYSYFLPVSTPPCALVSGPSRMGGKEMMVSGSGTFLACIVTLLVMFPLYAPFIWDFTFPDWARDEVNVTITTASAI